MELAFDVKVGSDSDPASAPPRAGARAERGEFGLNGGDCLPEKTARPFWFDGGYWASNV